MSGSGGNEGGEISVSRRNDNSVNDSKVALQHHEEEDVDIPIESKISKTLSERTTKIVIILVLIMLFF
jgi:hypothetical protein